MRIATGLGFLFSCDFKDFIVLLGYESKETLAYSPIRTLSVFKICFEWIRLFLFVSFLQFYHHSVPFLLLLLIL